MGDDAGLAPWRARPAEWHVGPVAASAERRLYTSAFDDPLPTGAEHARVYERLAACVTAHVDRAFPGERFTAYIRGDYFGDRTEELHIYPARFADRAGTLTELIRLVQAALREGELARWRVATPLGEGLLIYPDRICGVRPFSEDELEAEVQRRLREDLSGEAAARATALAQYERMLPSLPAALQEARRKRSIAHLVTPLEVEGDVACAWLLHPRVACGDDLDRLRISPDVACYRQCFQVLADGSVRSDPYEAVAPAGAMTLVLWEWPGPGPASAWFRQGWRIRHIRLCGPDPRGR